MSSDEFARELFEDAKKSLIQARSEASDLIAQRDLRHALLSAFSFLELQIELISQHFKASDFFTIHERGIIAQREVAFEKGVFRIKNTVRFSKLSDRMLLFQNKFSGSKLTERDWWGALLGATERRNSVAHPRGPVSLEIEQTEKDLLAVLGCADDLFRIVFGKGIPYSTLGAKPKLTI